MTMRALKRLTIGIAMTLAAWAPAVVAPSPTADFDALKSLAGDWVRVGDDGKATGEVTSQWRVTAAGTAIVETLFPETEKEMVTIYRRDGDYIVLTHHCMLGNAPRMRAKAVGSGRLEFACEEGAELASENDAHMHHAIIERVDGDHLREEWSMQEGGKIVHTAKFDLVRRDRD